MHFSKRTIRSGFFMLCAVFAVSTIAAMASPASAADRPATLKVKVAPQVAKHGKSIEVRGASGTKGRKPVRVLFRDSATNTWNRLKTVTSDARGLYGTNVKARQSGQLRVSTGKGRFSPIRKLRVRSSLRIKDVNRYVKVGDRLGIRGVVRPAGVRRIKVVINGAGRTIHTKTKAHGGFALKWRPKTAGSYRVRVFSAGNKVAIGDSSRRFRVNGLRAAHASYYGPGLYGNGVACGGTLTPSTIGVAHKTLPCGTKVTIRYKGRTVRVPVIDRGPYIAGRDYDLTEAVRNRLGFGGVGTVWVSH